jgi:XTP/dITP diphosphohydrolase
VSDPTGGLRTLVLATGNPGKLRELRGLLEPAGIEVRPQDELGVPEADETGASFIENALLKARNAARHTGLAALADDSGLAVDALGGAPGIRSARYAGEPGDDAANNAKLLSALDGVPLAERGARFICAMALVRHADDPVPIVCVGEWRGLIADAERGDNGFGYDPLFIVPERGCRSAELSAADKGQLSHRGRALGQLLARIRADT